MPINKQLRDILDRLPRSEDDLVSHQRPSKKYPDGGRPLAERRLLVSLKRLCKRCGFRNPDPDVPLPDVPLPDVPLPDVPLPDVPLPPAGQLRRVVPADRILPHFRKPDRLQLPAGVRPAV